MAGSRGGGTVRGRRGDGEPDDDGRDPRGPGPGRRPRPRPRPRLGRRWLDHGGPAGGGDGGRPGPTGDGSAGPSETDRTPVGPVPGPTTVTAVTPREADGSPAVPGCVRCTGGAAVGRQRRAAGRAVGRAVGRGAAKVGDIGCGVRRSALDTDPGRALGSVPSAGLRPGGPNRAAFRSKKAEPPARRRRSAEAPVERTTRRAAARTAAPASRPISTVEVPVRSRTARSPGRATSTRRCYVRPRSGGSRFECRTVAITAADDGSGPGPVGPSGPVRPRSTWPGDGGR